jgi:regulator of replication initiation timing
MERKVEELANLVRDLLREVAELRDRVGLLEARVAASETGSEEPKAAPREETASLASLYREGYHVCPVAYGRLREGECLFCVNFLERQSEA